MTDTITGLTDNDILTEGRDITTEGGAAVPTIISEGDSDDTADETATDTDGTDTSDADGTDGTDADGTDGSDADGTDGSDADGADA